MKGSIGTAMGGRELHRAHWALRSKIQAQRYKNPKGQSFGHRLNVFQMNERSVTPEVMFVLIDYSTKDRLRAKVMTHYAAAVLNSRLAGSGLAWAKIDQSAVKAMKVKVFGDWRKGANR